MKKIFILDDDLDLTAILQSILSKNYEIKISLTAKNICEQIEQFKPDLLIIDHFIGLDNSGAILDKLQNAIPGFSIPFILFSATHDIEDKARKLGTEGFIEKPASITYIRNYIDNFFKNKN
jgi:DNA-binding NtrC family response regulator